MSIAALTLIAQEFSVNGSEPVSAIGPIMSWGNMGVMRYPITSAR